MVGHDVELFGDLLSLHCNLSSLFAHHGYSLDEGLELRSSRLTDLTARLTNTAIETIARAITRKDNEITTIIQNIGSLVLICRARR